MVSPELLRRYKFFSGLTPEEVAGVAMIAEKLSYPDGAIIFHDGDPATHIYLVTSGCVGLVHHIYLDGRSMNVEVGSTPPGEPCGVSSFVEPYRLTATAQCEGPVTAIAIEAQPLRDMSESNCHLGYAIMRQVACILAERLSYSRIQLAACRPW
jgi:CRP-like cAMP-binding protein